ncbi:MAG: DUF664 domain-containing protein [Propionibacteriaceae bacterium]|nr:DUF664 domain-containing protein [Propionibacteriaceae bacterium]
MDAIAVLTDAATRCPEVADAVLAGISDEALHAMPGGRGNSIAWLVWHAARQMDYQLAELSAAPQEWETGEWGARLGIDCDATAIGFGDSLDDVAGLRVKDPGVLRDYLGAVVAALATYLGGLSAAQLDEVVDTRWEPPVLRGVRLISMIDDAVAHLGQAAYARGLVEGWRVGY